MQEWGNISNSDTDALFSPIYSYIHKNTECGVPSGFQGMYAAGYKTVKGGKTTWKGIFPLSLATFITPFNLWSVY